MSVEVVGGIIYHDHVPKPKSRFTLFDVGEMYPTGGAIKEAFIKGKIKLPEELTRMAEAGKLLFGEGCKPIIMFDMNQGSAEWWQEHALVTQEGILIAGLDLRGSIEGEELSAIHSAIRQAKYSERV